MAECVTPSWFLLVPAFLSSQMSSGKAVTTWTGWISSGLTKSVSHAALDKDLVCPYIDKPNKNPPVLDARRSLNFNEAQMEQHLIKFWVRSAWALLLA